MSVLTHSPAPWERVGPEHPCCHVAGVQDANGARVADVAEEQDVDVIVGAAVAAVRIAELERENTRLKNSLSSVEEDLRVVRLQLLGRLGPQPLDLARENTTLKAALRGAGDALKAVQGKLCEARCMRAYGEDNHPAFTSHIPECDDARIELRAIGARLGAPAVTGTTSDKSPIRNLPHDPNGKLWIGYCDLCNGQHCLQVLDPAAKVERLPHRERPPAGTDRCVGFEPHPLAMYAEEFCVAPVYEAKPGETARPHFCGRPRSEHFSEPAGGPEQDRGAAAIRPAGCRCSKNGEGLTGPGAHVTGCPEARP